MASKIRAKGTMTCDLMNQINQNNTELLHAAFQLDEEEVKILIFAKGFLLAQ